MVGERKRRKGTSKLVAGKPINSYINSWRETTLLFSAIQFEIQIPSAKQDFMHDTSTPLNEPSSK